MKLGLIKLFVKAMRKCNSNGLVYFCKTFPSTSQTKLQEGIFVGPQIRRVLKDQYFEKTIVQVRITCSTGVAKVLDNVKSPSFQARVDGLVESYRKMSCLMSLKIHFLYYYFNFFSDNHGTVSGKHGKPGHSSYVKSLPRFLE